MIEIRERALRSAKDLFPTASIDELISISIKIEHYFLIGEINQSLIDFANHCMMQHPIKGNIGFTPYEYQKSLFTTIPDKHRTIINGSRQLGISLCLSIYALWLALSKPNQVIHIASPNYTSILANIDQMLWLSQNHTYSNRPQLMAHGKTNLSFSNGSTIIFGLIEDIRLNSSINLILIENAAYISHAKFNTFWDSLLDHPTIPMIINSSPNEESGVFYQTWTQHNTWHKIELPYTVHPERDADWVASVKK